MSHLEISNKTDGCDAPATVQEDDQSLTELYRQMYLIRRVEETLLDLFSKGRVSGTIHTCIGQEVCAVGVVGALDKSRDVLWTNHRGHGHFLAWTGNAEGLFAEILGRASGVCGGIGGSQHLHAERFYSNGILGGAVACAVGSAFAEKYKQSGAVVTVFMGDGAMAEGIVYESLNLSALWHLPVLFVLEDNGYAQSTPKRFEHAGEINTRAATFGIETTTMEASNASEVFSATSQIVSQIRHTMHPQVLALRTFRLAPHSKGDDTRSPEELASLRDSDPLPAFRAQLIRLGYDLNALESEVQETLERSLAVAETSPPAVPFI